MRCFALALVLTLSACAGVPRIPLDTPTEMIDRAKRWDAQLDEVQKRLYGAEVAIEVLCRVPATKPNCDLLYKGMELARAGLPKARKLVATYRELGVGGDQIDAAIARAVVAVDELEAALR